MKYSDYVNYMENQEKLTQQQLIDFNIDLSKNIPRFVLYAKKYIKEHEPKKTTYYMYTFTTKPDCDITKAENYIISTRNRMNNLNIVDLAYTKEHIESNLHFHVLIGSTRPIRSDAFKQYQTSYGKINLSKKKSETNIQIVDYLSKENDIIWLIKDEIIIM